MPPPASPVAPDIVVDRTASSLLEEGFSVVRSSPTQAITIARAALDRAEEEENPDAIARAYYLLGMGLRRTGDLRNGLEILSQAETLVGALPDRTLLPEIMQQRAGALTALGRQEEAAECLRSAKPIATELGDIATLQRICTTWALIYMRQDRYAEATNMLQEATSLLVELPDLPQELVVLNAFGSIYQRSHNYELAIEYYSKALEVARELEHSGKGQPRLHCSALICLADAMKDLARYPEMLPYLDEARALSERYDLIDIQASVRRGLGDHDLCELRLEDAIAHYLHAKDLLEATGNTMILMTVLQTLGESYTKLGEYATAKEYLLQSLKIARGTGNLEKEYTSHKLLGAMFMSLNEIQEANEALQAALATHEKLFNESNQRALRETEKRIVEEAARREQALMRIHTEELAASRDALKVLNEHQVEILRIVSHDMRNPLSAIRGIAHELVAAEALPAEEVRTIGKLIKESSEMLVSLTDQLLLAAQLETGSLKAKRKQVALSEVIDSCLRLIRPQSIHKQVTVTVECECGPERVQLDVDRFSRILNNLLSNAIKFTKPGGTVRVRCEAAPHEILLTVADSGIGIPESLLPSLFERFNPTRRNGTADEQGTGLGLPLVRQIVELEGGTISVRSIVGEGTTFEVSLPRS